MTLNISRECVTLTPSDFHPPFPGPKTRRPFPKRSLRSFLRFAFPGQIRGQTHVLRKLRHSTARTVKPVSAMRLPEQGADVDKKPFLGRVAVHVLWFFGRSQILHGQNRVRHFHVPDLRRIGVVGVRGPLVGGVRQIPRPIRTSDHRDRRDGKFGPHVDLRHFGFLRFDHHRALRFDALQHRTMKVGRTVPGATALSGNAPGAIAPRSRVTQSPRRFFSPSGFFGNPRRFF